MDEAQQSYVVLRLSKDGREQRFNLIDGRLHIPTVKEALGLRSLLLENCHPPMDTATGLTLAQYPSGAVILAGGEPTTRCPATQVLLVRILEGFVEPDSPSGGIPPGKRRKVALEEEVLGVWPLPAPGDWEAGAPTLGELHARIQQYLQVDPAQCTSWVYKYMWHGQLVPILSDAALQQALLHLTPTSSSLATNPVSAVDGEPKGGEGAAGEAAIAPATAQAGVGGSSGSAGASPPRLFIAESAGGLRGPLALSSQGPQGSLPLSSCLQGGGGSVAAPAPSSAATMTLPPSASLPLSQQAGAGGVGGPLAPGGFGTAAAAAAAAAAAGAFQREPSVATAGGGSHSALTSAAAAVAAAAAAAAAAATGHLPASHSLAAALQGTGSLPYSFTAPPVGPSASLLNPFPSGSGSLLMGMSSGQLAAPLGSLQQAFHQLSQPGTPVGGHHPPLPFGSAAPLQQQLQHYLHLHSQHAAAASAAAAVAAAAASAAQHAQQQSQQQQQQQQAGGGRQPLVSPFAGHAGMEPGLAMALAEAEQAAAAGHAGGMAAMAAATGVGAVDTPETGGGTSGGTPLGGHSEAGGASGAGSAPAAPPPSAAAAAALALRHTPSLPSIQSGSALTSPGTCTAGRPPRRKSNLGPPSGGARAVEGAAAPAAPASAGSQLLPPGWPLVSGGSLPPGAAGLLLAGARSGSFNGAAATPANTGAGADGSALLGAGSGALGETSVFASIPAQAALLSMLAAQAAADSGQTPLSAASHRTVLPYLPYLPQQHHQHQAAAGLAPDTLHSGVGGAGPPPSAGGPTRAPGAGLRPLRVPPRSEGATSPPPGLPPGAPPAAGYGGGAPQHASAGDPGGLPQHPHHQHPYGLPAETPASHKVGGLAAALALALGEDTPQSLHSTDVATDTPMHPSRHQPSPHQHMVMSSAAPAGHHLHSQQGGGDSNPTFSQLHHPLGHQAHPHHEPQHQHQLMEQSMIQQQLQHQQQQQQQAPPMARNSPQLRSPSPHHLPPGDATQHHHHLHHHSQLPHLPRSGSHKVAGEDHLGVSGMTMGDLGAGAAQQAGDLPPTGLVGSLPYQHQQHQQGAGTSALAKADTMTTTTTTSHSRRPPRPPAGSPSHVAGRGGGPVKEEPVGEGGGAARGGGPAGSRGPGASRGSKRSASDMGAHPQDSGGGDGGTDEDEDDEGSDPDTAGGAQASQRGGRGGKGGRGKGASSKGMPKTRYQDGRFRDESHHAKKMGEMRGKLDACFDGAIKDLLEIVDHKKITCGACLPGAPPITAYTAYHVDCVRKHFLRHHLGVLAERGVQPKNYVKQYEVNTKVGTTAVKVSATSAPLAAAVAAVAAASVEEGRGVPQAGASAIPHTNSGAAPEQQLRSAAPAASAGSGKPPGTSGSRSRARGDAAKSVTAGSSGSGAGGGSGRPSRSTAGKPPPHPESGSGPSSSSLPKSSPTIRTASPNNQLHRSPGLPSQPHHPYGTSILGAGGSGDSGHHHHQHQHQSPTGEGLPRAPSAGPVGHYLGSVSNLANLADMALMTGPDAAAAAGVPGGPVPASRQTRARTGAGGGVATRRGSRASEGAGVGAPPHLASGSPGAPQQDQHQQHQASYANQGSNTTPADIGAAAMNLLVGQLPSAPLGDARAAMAAAAAAAASSANVGSNDLGSAVAAAAAAAAASAAGMPGLKADGMAAMIQAMIAQQQQQQSHAHHQQHHHQQQQQPFPAAWQGGLPGLHSLQGSASLPLGLAEMLAAAGAYNYPAGGVHGHPPQQQQMMHAYQPPQPSSAPGVHTAHQQTPPLRRTSAVITTETARGPTSASPPPQGAMTQHHHQHRSSQGQQPTPLSPDSTSLMFYQSPPGAPLGPGRGFAPGASGTPGGMSAVTPTPPPHPGTSRPPYLTLPPDSTGPPIGPSGFNTPGSAPDHMLSGASGVMTAAGGALNTPNSVPAMASLLGLPANEDSLPPHLFDSLPPLTASAHHNMSHHQPQQQHQSQQQQQQQQLMDTGSLRQTMGGTFGGMSHLFDSLRSQGSLGNTLMSLFPHGDSAHASGTGPGAGVGGGRDARWTTIAAAVKAAHAMDAEEAAAAARAHAAGLPPGGAPGMDAFAGPVAGLGAPSAIMDPAAAPRTYHHQLHAHQGAELHPPPPAPVDWQPDSSVRKAPTAGGGINTGAPLCKPVTMLDLPGPPSAPPDMSTAPGGSGTPSSVAAQAHARSQLARKLGYGSLARALSGSSTGGGGPHSRLAGMGGSSSDPASGAGAGAGVRPHVASSSGPGAAGGSDEVSDDEDNPLQSSFNSAKLMTYSLHQLVGLHKDSNAGEAPGHRPPVDPQHLPLPGMTTGTPSPLAALVTQAVAAAPATNLTMGSLPDAAAARPDGTPMPPAARPDGVGDVPLPIPMAAAGANINPPVSANPAGPLAVGRPVEPAPAAGIVVPGVGTAGAADRPSGPGLLRDTSGHVLSGSGPLGCLTAEGGPASTFSGPIISFEDTQPASLTSPLNLRDLLLREMPRELLLGEDARLGAGAGAGAARDQNADGS